MRQAAYCFFWNEKNRRFIMRITSILFSRFSLLLVTTAFISSCATLPSKLHADDSLLPNLYISEFTLTPTKPTKGQPVHVRVGVYNRGNAPAGSFNVEWWPGENYTSPACSWRVDGLVARGGKILKCRYDGYPSRYASIPTKAVADSGGAVVESNENDNMKKMVIRVK